MSEVIFTTVHGSHLYGFAHARSDFDTFTVTDSPRSKVRQTVDAHGNDRVVVGIHRFLDLAMSGSHQSVEAMFSPHKTWGFMGAGGKWRALIENARVGGGDVADKYERTIRSFCYGDFKLRRHAVRLRLNLDELRWKQRLDWVQLSDVMVAHCTRLAEEFTGDELAHELGVYRSRWEAGGGLVQS